MAKRSDTVAITFRAPVSVIEQLDELCRLSGVKRGDFLINAITLEYDKVNGNPELKKLLEQMRGITIAMKKMTGQE